MDKVDRLIAIVRQLKEEMAMTTGSSGPVAGFSAQSPAAGPVAGTTYPMGIPDGRSGVMKRLPEPYRKALIKSKPKKKRKKKSRE